MTKNSKNIITSSYAGTKSIKEAAKDLGISESMLYHRLQLFLQGDKTKAAALEEEL